MKTIAPVPASFAFSTDVLSAARSLAGGQFNFVTAAAVWIGTDEKAKEAKSSVLAVALSAQVPGLSDKTVANYLGTARTLATAFEAIIVARGAGDVAGFRTWLKDEAKAKGHTLSEVDLSRMARGEIPLAAKAKAEAAQKLANAAAAAEAAAAAKLGKAAEAAPAETEQAPVTPPAEPAERKEAAASVEADAKAAKDAHATAQAAAPAPVRDTVVTVIRTASGLAVDCAALRAEEVAEVVAALMAHAAGLAEVADAAARHADTLRRESIAA